MRKLFLAILMTLTLPLTAGAFSVPSKPTGFVNDYAGILTPDDKAALEAKLSGYEGQTKNEISVVIIPSLDGDVIENVAQEIFTAWGIGKKGTDNGALLLISMAEHKTRIHTGYGLEGTLTDIGTSYIQSDILAPAFRAGDYYGGINATLDKMIGLVSGTDFVPADYTPPTAGNSGNIDWIQVAIFCFIILQALVSVMARTKSWWLGGLIGVLGGVVVGFFATFLFAVVSAIVLGGVGLLFDRFISKSYLKYKSRGKHLPLWLGGGGGIGGS